MIFVRIILVMVIAIGTFLTLDLAYASSQDTKIAVSPLPEPIKAVADATTAVTISPTPGQFDGDLDKAVSEALEGSKGTYSVVIKDLKTGNVYSRNADHIYATASLYKLWVMAETYRQIAKGEFDEDTKISGSVESLNKAFGISSESAELKEGGFTMTVKEALEKMITISHNYAALMLTQKIKTVSMKAFLQEFGFMHSKVGPDPESNAADMALFLEKLYRGELGTKENTGKMLALLAGQKLNDRIPKYLPTSTRIMHKTGELYGVKHDVGIVEGPHGDYIIVLMSDTSNPKTAAEREANVSKGVWEYFSK